LGLAGDAALGMVVLRMVVLAVVLCFLVLDAMVYPVVCVYFSKLRLMMPSFQFHAQNSPKSILLIPINAALLPKYVHMTGTTAD
jgi:hypothetical protein